jgi:hypothetical protein
MSLDGFDRLGDAHREDAPGMECLPQRLIIDAEVTRPRMDPEALRCRDACHRLLDCVQEGQDIAGIARIPCGYAVCKDKARGRVRHDAGLTAKLRGTIAFPFEDGSAREIVGIDQLTVQQLLAMGEPGGLRADVGMAAQCRVERLSDTLALGVTERRRLVQEMLGLLPQCGNGLAKLQELLLRVAHQLYQDPALTTALAAKAPHDFFQLLVELLGLTRENRGSAAALVRDVFDERQRFFVLYTVWWHR